MTWGLWGYDFTASRTAGSYPSDDQVDAAEVMNGIRTLADFSHRTHPGAVEFLDMPPDEQFDHFNTHLAPLYELHGLPIPGSGGWLDFTDAVKEHWRGQRTASRTAALDSDLAARLHDEFHDWWGKNKDELFFSEPNNHGRGPLGHWPNIEQFLQDRYPAAHKDFDMGREQARHMLDRPQMMEDGYFTRYETGPDAVAKHGYDPAEVAAGMLLLHNQTHPHRWDDHQDDLERLTDIVTKRHQMQQQHDNPTPGLLDGYDTTKIPWHEQDMLHKNQHILDSDTLHRYLQKNHPESIRTAGAGGDLPEGLNFQAHDGWTHAYDGDTLIGYLRPHQNKIDMIKVHPEYRRRGIGTAMLNWHRDNVDPSIAHSTDQTPLGRAWGKSVGWEPPVWNRQDPDIDTLEDYEVERGPHTAARLAMPTWYHLTNNPDFSLDPNHQPVNLNDTDDEGGSGPLGAGVFITKRPDDWAFSQQIGLEGGEWSGERPYVAEIDAPRGVHRLPGAWYNRDAVVPGIYPPGEDETVVPADQFHHRKVKRVRPRTAARLAALPDGLHIQPEDDDWVAYHQGTPVGSLSVDYSTEVPSIDSIRVHPDYRRHGIGKALWEAAGRPAHTPDDMSADGQAWARAVGGPRLAMSAPKFPDFGHQLPHVGPMPGTDPGDGHDESWWNNGGCGSMALAFKNMWPDLKIGAEIVDGDTVHHAWVHDGKHAHDAYGTHVNDPTAGGPTDENGVINMDVDPGDLAHMMDSDWSEDEPWEDSDVRTAGKEIEHHWFGYDFDTGEYHNQHNQKEAHLMTAAVTVYTKPNCPQCTMTKKQLDRLGIEHRVIDVTVDPDAHAYVTGLGYQQAPVVVVGDGEQHWGGFSPDKLKGLLS